MSEVIVRLATSDDLNALHEVLTYLHDGPPWGDGQRDRARLVLEEIIDDPQRGLHLGVVNGRPAGTIDVVVAQNLTRNLRPFAVVENVVVVPDFRRAGLGGRLMQAALDFAQDQGCYKVQLVSANQRGAAHQLYRSMGFEADVSGYRRYLTLVD